SSLIFPASKLTHADPSRQALERRASSSSVPCLQPAAMCSASVWAAAASSAGAELSFAEDIRSRCQSNPHALALQVPSGWRMECDVSTPQIRFGNQMRGVHAVFDTNAVAPLLSFAFLLCSVGMQLWPLWHGLALDLGLTPSLISAALTAIFLFAR